MIPEEYYRQDKMADILRQKRLEKINTHIYKDSIEGSVAVAERIASLIREKASLGEKCMIGLSGGTSTLAVYDELVKKYIRSEISFADVIVFNITEFYPVSAETRHSNKKIICKYLLDHVDFNMHNFITPGQTTDMMEVQQFCRRFDELAESNDGLDFVLLSIGLAGNVAYNEPGSQISAQTRMVLLDNNSKRDLKAFFPTLDDIPSKAITIGMSTIQEAKEVVVLGWGEHKSAILKESIQGKVNENVPASFLQLHKNATVVLDLSGAQQLTRINMPWLVGPCIWNDKLIRRAIIWLCEITQKPILKLTNKDYNLNGLDELLVLYGSAYQVNIKVFNDLQHTITGWPGGKPNADDTNRPERAIPYPKRVLLFSPHPDDDVISMGGTLQRLVDQGHDVHVAYQTSGNIAVNDENVMSLVTLMKEISNLQHFKTHELSGLCESTVDFLTVQKKNDDVDNQLVLFLKGQIRREEARTACRFVGVKSENVHFLDLPFYETGRIQKNKLSEADVLKVMTLVDTIQPHQIYLAGDLEDPHGTHKVCLDAVLASLEELKIKTWMKDCRCWMYRGAWAEWEPDHIEMAVPISPEELRKKRNSILKHQSQMEGAPFLGNDERLFWQRSEDRNRATANLYRDLGLASYEAIEAFVEYKIKF
jgi:glucosamine-6-phosphate deaminase